ncbi:hypothetical protein [Pseudoalteromonas luteoviolacea]|uniref:Uncharacterized protein n=1 Tax=Pseudoalteromonas luteoviolacea DSM 6061 TaxID=1365250 RepID=A0A166U954_9GAMM|nr:hypothetical protein [Pseudoalteromonas luteoviolacea]KZN29687.1 hypothetical protein N475_05160 [Pseudoalteromonas luteoviolacea DSM 6061]MBE0389423.1 hypothetical protein [Pseudoalteromonas luteoviolacea DSM 6061]
MKKLTTLLLPLALLSTNALAVVDVEMKVSKLPKKVSKEHKQIAAELASSNCAYVVNPVADIRQNKDAISWKVNATGIQQWFNTIHQDVVTPLLPKAKKDIVIEVTPKLNMLYTYNEQLNINGMAVSTVDYSINGKPAGKYYVRGFNSDTNWANGDGEFVGSAEHAAQHMITRILKKLPEICGNAQSA